MWWFWGSKKAFIWRLEFPTETHVNFKWCFQRQSNSADNILPSLLKKKKKKQSNHHRSHLLNKQITHFLSRILTCLEGYTRNLESTQQCRTFLFLKILYQSNMFTNVFFIQTINLVKENKPFSEISLCSVKLKFNSTQVKLWFLAICCQWWR